MDHIWRKPTGVEIDQAIAIYLQLAYGDATFPASVHQRLEQLRGAGESMWESPAWEKDALVAPSRYNLRLGNPWYPHMKLTVEQSPDGEGYLLRVDTHDHHIQVDPKNAGYTAFCQLQEKNQQLAQAIETAWENQSLTTFNSYLRQDLLRRTGSSPEFGAIISGQV